MTDRDVDLFAFDPAHGRPAEFGAIARASGRRSNEHSHALLVGAENLLDKAATSILAGDEERADRLIARAAAMPYDEHEEGSPGIRGAQQLVYDLVSDWFEESPADDDLWLEVALRVHEAALGPARADLASVLHGFVLQGELFELTRSEVERIRWAVGDAPLEVDLGDTPGLTPDQRIDIIRSLVEVTATLRKEYDAALD